MTPSTNSPSRLSSKWKCPGKAFLLPLPQREKTTSLQHFTLKIRFETCFLAGFHVGGLAVNSPFFDELFEHVVHNLHPFALARLQHAVNALDFAFAHDGRNGLVANQDLV